MDLAEWDGACDDPEYTGEDICHCSGANNTATAYTNVKCRIVEQEALGQSLSVFLFLYDLIVIGICAYWLVSLWMQRNSRYEKHLNVRRPTYIILSYAMILPWIFEEGVATIYLFFTEHDQDRSEKWDGANYWTNYDGSPIYFDYTADIALHFFFWFGFWAFFQLKVFKLWMLRYHYEYQREMSNIEWKDHLGLRTVEATSFFLHYRSILGNASLMFVLQAVVLVIIIFFQIFLRLVPGLNTAYYSSTIESVVILLIVVSEFIFMVWLIHQTNALDDHFYLRDEAKRLFISGAIAGVLWIIGIIIAGTATNVPFIYVRAGGTLLLTTWVCCCCYIETIWLLKRVDKDWTKQTMLAQHDDGNVAQYRLSDILQVQEGFEAMMRFLVSEFSCENLLCYVELTQWIWIWGEPVAAGGDARHRANQWDQIGSMQEEQPLNIEQGHFKSGDMDDDAFPMENFAYFQRPEFDDELRHYEYLLQKYIYDSASLQINISHNLRHQAQDFNLTPGAPVPDILRLFNRVRAELWALTRDSFTRFKQTEQYRKLVISLEKNADFQKHIQQHLRTYGGGLQQPPRNGSHQRPIGSTIESKAEEKENKMHSQSKPSTSTGPSEAETVGRTHGATATQTGTTMGTPGGKVKGTGTTQGGVSTTRTAETPASVEMTRM